MRLRTLALACVAVSALAGVAHSQAPAAKPATPDKPAAAKPAGAVV
jgi:hypothetical protein